MYRNFFKRFFDFVLSLFAVIVLSPLLLCLTVIGAIKMKGNPFFLQLRPGKKDKYGNEKIFKLIKLRTMTNEKDAEGNLLPDKIRLVPYGKWLRSTSLDELFELINILKGDMAIIGPRPQLVKDLVFMTDEQRKRHTVRPGLSGLAQVSGRNALAWDTKLKLDLEYIENITLIGDVKLIIRTCLKVLKREGITEEGEETATDFGEHLLKDGAVTPEEYEKRQAEAQEMLEKVNV